LSSLLLQKQDLEQKASSLAASQAAGAQPDPKAGALQASLELVQRQFRDNPAYLLLKTRFLAIFSLPAFLATLPPNSIPTTLSPDVAVVSESDSEDLGDLELKDRARQLDCMACRVQASPAAPDPVQVWMLDCSPTSRDRQRSLQCLLGVVRWAGGSCTREKAVGS
jgi:snRNA-activating protein complex subunit 4